MDGTSLALAVFGFAYQLYNTVLEGYKLLHEAKTASESASRLRTLASIEQIRLATWAQEIGLVDHATELEEQLKEDKMVYAVIVESLGHAADLLTRYQDLEAKYGLKSSVDRRGQWFGITRDNNAVNDDDVNEPTTIPTIKTFWSPESQFSFQQTLLVFQKRLSRMKKFTWAVRDNHQFQTLVDTLRTLNDGLEHILPPFKRRALERALINGQPSDPAALRVLIHHQAISPDYVTAARFRAKMTEQRQAEMNLTQLSSIGRVLPDTNDLVIVQATMSPSGQAEVRSLHNLVQSGKTSRVFVEHLTLKAADTIFFRRFVQLIDLLRMAPKPVGYRILDCQGYVRDDHRRTERYAIVSCLPSFLANTPDVRYATLHSLLRDSDDNTTPLNYPLAHRYRLAGLIANSISHIHFAGWLHRGLSSHNIVCFSAGSEQRSSIQHPYLCGFAHTRPDDPREISQHEAGTTSNLYRHPDYQLPSPTNRFRRSYEIYSVGVLLVEIGLWKRIGTFKLPDHTNAMFALHLRDVVVPQLGFYMGQIYQDATLKCLDTALLKCGDDEGYYLSSVFSKQVVQALESCYVV